MSNPGMDPMQAMAAQQAPMDPMEAMAAGRAPILQPVPAPQKPLSWMDRADAAMRGFANGGLFNLADVEGAAIDAAIPSHYPGSSIAPSYWQRFKEDVPYERQNTAKRQQQSPGTSFVSGIVGGFANPVARALPVAKTLGGAIAQGAAIGAGYGAGGSVGTAKNFNEALGQTLVGAGTGAASGAAAHGIGKLLTGATRSPDAQLLYDEGVPLTPGQSLGGTAHTIEDATTHVPLLGNAIKARQGDAITGFNRAAYNRVLEPLGLDYEDAAPVGNEGIGRLQSLIGDAYDRAFDGAVVKNNDGFNNAISQIGTDSADALPKDRVTQLTQAINNRLTSKFDANGELSGKDLISAKNWFAEQARSGPSASLDDRALSNAYGAVVDALKDGIGAEDPARKSMLDAADNAYMRFVKVGQAASSNAASAKGGTFTPAQLGQAIRMTDQSTRRLDFAKGVAPLQDLAQAGQSVLPSTVPDSGTATRGLMEAAPWLLAGAATRPVATGLAAGGLGAGTALYSRPGQALAQALLFGAPASRKAMGVLPKTLLPGLIAALQASPASAAPPDKRRQP